MDPFSIAAGSASLATLCVQCSSFLYSFYEGTRKVDATILDFSDELHQLAQVLDALSTNFKHPRTLAVIHSAQRECDDKLWRNVDQLLRKCRGSMEMLKAIVERLNRDTGGMGGFLRRPIKQLRLRLQNDDIVALRGQIQSHHLMMQITLQSISM